jgi:hypothetical protein
MVLTPARRNHYFYGKILNVGDLEMEQDYGKQERWLSTASPSDQGASTGFRWESATTGSRSPMPVIHYSNVVGWFRRKRS